MTTGESTDNVEVMENVTVTSDVAFERVTSDEHFEEEKSGGFLQQNTSGLVQEIPNISFLDIADTMLENYKTLYDRENWVLRVGKAGRSIEAQPQDIVTLKLNADYSVSAGRSYIEYDGSLSSGNYTVCKPTQTYNISSVEILQSGYYTISYGWTVDTNSATSLNISVFEGDIVNPTTIVGDEYKDTNLPNTMSGGKYKPNVLLNAGDILFMMIEADDTIKIYADTYFNVQFQQYIL